MTANNNSWFSLTGPNHTVAHPLLNAPFVPSAEEAQHRYCGLPSHPLFIARSSHDIWIMPTSMEYIQPKELRRVGEHPLTDIWEGNVDIAMHSYLVEHEVQYTSLDPVRIGTIHEAAAPVIIWVGVEPGSLSAMRGIEVAVGLRTFLLQNNIDDVHIEIRESVVSRSAKMYNPALTSNPTVQVREPLSTALGITICAEATPEIQGTATLFFTVSSKPDKLFLLAAKHVLSRIDEENNHYEYHNSAPRRNVLLLGTNGFKAYIEDIMKRTRGCKIVIENLEGRLELANKVEDPQEAQAERDDVQAKLKTEQRALQQLQQFLADVRRDWEDPKKRIIGHIVLSPPLILGAGEDGFTQDLAVIEVDTTKVDVTNFRGNFIDLGTEIAVETFTAWMRPGYGRYPNQPLFKYPSDRLLQFHNTLSNEEMCSPNPENVDERGNPTIMVIKRGFSSGLTVGCLNNICSVLRTPFRTQPGEYSREVAVLPRTYKAGAFSEPGDSGAAVINGLGAVVGMLTSSSGSNKLSDCTYITPISFLLKCLGENGFPANIFPVAADVFA